MPRPGVAERAERQLPVLEHLGVAAVTRVPAVPRTRSRRRPTRFCPKSRIVPPDGAVTRVATGSVCVRRTGGAIRASGTGTVS